MKCNVRPYEGNEPYIFFSYCHENAWQTYPVMEKLVYDGYRIWYDDGLHPGDEWPERIAEKLAGCHVCMAALSQKFSESHNCKNELTFAINNQKPLLVIKLEDFPMSMGMRMQLSNTQYIEKYQYDSESSFFEKLYSARLKAMEVCKGGTNRRVVIDWNRAPEDKKTEVPPLYPSGLVSNPEQVPAPKPEPVPEQVPAPKPEPVSEPNMEPKPEPAPEPNVEPKSEPAPEPVTQPTPVPYSKPASVPNPKSAPKLAPVPNWNSEASHRSALSPIIIQYSSGRIFEGSFPVTSIGRDKNKCNISFSEGHIGGHHIDIKVQDKKYYVIDRNSRNHTWVDGKRLETGAGCEIGLCSEVRIANETLIVAFGKAAEFLRKFKLLVRLQSETTKESRYMLAETFVLGRSHAWSGGVLTERHISRTHAILRITKKGCILSDVSTYNQTWVNERRIPAKEDYLLAEKDRIRIGGQGGEYFIVHLKVLEEDEVQ